ncbi:MAG: ABC transporter ATP-binding protein [Burkholderiaceae bacterium]
MASLSLKSIRKSYDGITDIIKGVDLEIRDGEFMVFVGPSGCGKSTLLRMIAGLEDIDDGELHIGEQCVNDVSPSDRGVAMVFQSYALYPHMSVAENMGFALKMARHPKAEVAAAVGRAAEILQISHLLDRKPKELSGGQRQRVAIGRAIVRSPKVFLFDEPLSNLDAALRVQMRTELARLHRELGTTMIYVTHDQVEAMTLGQRIAVFNGGRIAQVGEPMELYDRPANLFVAGFLGSPKMNFVPVTVSAGDGAGLRVRSREGDGEFALAAAAAAGGPAVGDNATLGFRPDQVEIADEDAAAGALRGHVDLVERLGDATLVHVNCAGHSAPLIVRLPGHATPLATGSVVALRPDLARSRLFDSAGDAYRLSA